MGIRISLEKLTEKIVDISKDLFEKYEAGIRADFEAYMQENHAKAIHDGIVDMEELGTGVLALRRNYLTKASSDYSAHDCAGFALEGHDRITAECMSEEPVEEMISMIMDDPDSIGDVYIKRMVTTGRLVACVNRKAAEDLLSKQAVISGAEEQIRHADADLLVGKDLLSEDRTTVKASVIDLIAERTAALIMEKMALGHAV